MIGRIAALNRHPIKGFTPEALDAAHLDAGAHFPCDRIYSVEDGPSGFDPSAPAHISKMRFAVLAKIPALARARTRYDDATGQLSVDAEGMPSFLGNLTTSEDRAAFASWLGGFLKKEAPDRGYGRLRVLAAPEHHRFMDSKRGFVSILNVESVRDLGRRLGRSLETARFRANVLVEGWPAWSEYGREPGVSLFLGGSELKLMGDIDRCAATHVDPETGIKDIDLVPALFSHTGHNCCGVYAEVSTSGWIAVGDRAVID